MPCVVPGTFGRVLECWDRKHKSYVAIKIVRNVQKYRDAAMIEVSSLSGPVSLLNTNWLHTAQDWAETYDPAASREGRSPHTAAAVMSCPAAAA